MTIHLSGQREQLILSLLRAGKFTSADEVIDEALRLVGQRYPASGASSEAVASAEAETTDRAVLQRENLQRLSRKLDAMPVAAVDDGLSNRDHDRMLYGQ